MPRPWSRRVHTSVCVGAGVAVGVMLAAFVWPGFFYYWGCALSSGPFESINNRTYCYATVPLPKPSTDYYANHTEWGFTFELFTPTSPGFSGMTIKVTEPSGTEYSGSMAIGGPSRPGFTSMWFAPNNESGVTVMWNSQNVSLLVSR